MIVIDKKSALAILLMISLIGIGIGRIVYNHINVSEGIKVIEYKAAGDDKLKVSYQIQKIENINAATWVSNNEILNLIENGKYNLFSSRPYYSCSIYNIETKKEKLFDNVCIEGGEIYGVSPDGKYLLYKEGDDEFDFKEMSAEEFFNSEMKSKIKLIDLSSGKINDFEETKFLGGNEYTWVDNNKIICVNNNTWYIKDIDGKIFDEGKIDGCIDLLGANNVYVYEGKLQGDMFYINALENKKGVYTEYSLCKLNLDTKENTEIKRFDISSVFTMKGNTISQVLQGKQINYLDKEGDLMKRVANEESNTFIFNSTLSTDGNKGAFLYVDSNSEEYSTGINIIDIKTGIINEISKVSDLKESESQNDYVLEYYYNMDEEKTEVEKSVGPKIKIGSGLNQLAWSKNGKSLIFTYKYNSKQDDKNHIDSYIVKFE